MSDQGLTDDERELLRLLWGFEDIANAFNCGKAQLSDLYAAESSVLAHYRKAKLDVALRATNSAPSP